MTKVLENICEPCRQGMHDICAGLAETPFDVGGISCPCRDRDCLEARTKKASQLPKAPRLFHYPVKTGKQDESRDFKAPKTPLYNQGH